MTRASLFAGVIASLSLMLFFIPAQSAEAGPIIRSGQEVSIDVDQVLEGDFYGFGTTVTVSGEAEHDVFIAGGSVTMNGNVLGDLTVLSGDVSVHGTVKDDVRVLGGKVQIAAPVEGDVVVLGGKLSILSTGSVSGDVLFLGMEANVEGPVQGSIYGSAEQVRINTTVGGDVDVRTTKLFNLGDKANVGGNVTYRSATDLLRAQNAVVAGTVRKEDLIVEQNTGGLAKVAVMQILATLFASLSFFLVARPSLEGFVKEVSVSYGRYGLIGLGVLIGVPVISILLVTSLLGTMVGLTLIFGYIFFLLISWVASAIVIGAFLARAIHSKELVSLTSVVAGTVVLSLIAYIPVVGPLALVALLVIVLGGLASSLYRLFR